MDKEGIIDLDQNGLKKRGRHQKDKETRELFNNTIIDLTYDSIRLKSRKGCSKCRKISLLNTLLKFC